ncbi:uncharacterized protein LOC128674739 [Plodia interpunctella]|uniref:uncharacterized protein LOC128674739 n=1 Tax=Plodia interpunctella TaxID=58824 RepID=UPI002367EB7A|nr:uncharacterized protein LOC128674739 [Plodia interpunctella]XP_053609568.1 uncharacterized protein LOC128674739 [Plodia interpunctella]XP_053609569.1 uncharacterized protein LOC128674739 [Plodia interpunctella]XP_053609570.1 uncharacterized protein LOC128674739 [Plodia interpunctella]XP_053609571.1 uncharacterized protein LOC128674739 [Plodia interpunctella]XP_053609572.1 uncharacterized protein LOC128674739 [Plodia interpunctella]
MESSNILNRMASYDFKAPIDIIWFDEENSNEVINIDLTSSPDSNEKEIVLLNTEARNDNVGQTQISEKSSEKLFNVSKKNNKRKQTTDRSNTSKNRKQKKVSNISHEYVTEELKTISKYLTLIIESYNHYLSVLKNKKYTYDYVSQSKISFLITKQHFFNAAYNYVVSYILPNETNQSFTELLLNYTSNIVIERIKTDYYLSIRELYFEMIQWVKLRQFKMLNNSIDKSILRKHLNDPSKISSAKDIAMNVQQLYSSNTNPNKLCIFSSGPIGSEISINIDKSLIPNQNQIPNHNKEPVRNSVELEHNQVIQHHNELPLNRNLSFHNINFPNTISEAQQNVRESESRLQQYQPYVVNENNGISQNAYFNYYHTTNNYQSNNFTGNNIMHRTAELPPKVVRNQYGNLRSFRRENVYTQTPGQDMLRPPPYSSLIADYRNQIELINQAPVVQSDMSSGPDLTRSSVSTDSGFISPIGSKTCSNAIEDIVNQLLELENSIQPTKSPATKITCHVCHAKSTLMCAACFKTNYCSTQCQRVDWENHRLICR